MCIWLWVTIAVSLVEDLVELLSQNYVGKKGFKFPNINRPIRINKNKHDCITD